VGYFLKDRFDRQLEAKKGRLDDEQWEFEQDMTVKGLQNGVENT